MPKGVLNLEEVSSLEGGSLKLPNVENIYDPEICVEQHVQLVAYF
ncbi:predicted protein [Botrytis cinerea T4]|uniref:Uncharacterized protein n=1 Tax=Botryotinia fuckeliana (strain T4) TaxID=999810 RepID=G2XR16_BOTF4|nr:predicted protein [Botrytis cinerea T4]